MKKLWSICYLLLISCFLVGCNSHEISGNGKITSVVKDLPNITQVSISGDYSLKIIAGQKQQKIAVSADENLIPYIKFNFSGDKLEIVKASNITLKPSKKIEIIIEVQKLALVSLLGSHEAVIDAAGFSNFKLSVSGTSKINLTNKASELVINTSGSNEIMALGTTKKLLIDSSGASTIKAKALTANDVMIKSVGGAKIEVYAEDELVLDISGSGSVDYYGNPKITQKVTGAVAVSNKK